MWKKIIGKLFTGSNVKDAVVTSADDTLIYYRTQSDSVCDISFWRFCDGDTATVSGEDLNKIDNIFDDSINYEFNGTSVSEAGTDYVITGVSLISATYIRFEYTPLEIFSANNYRFNYELRYVDDSATSVHDVIRTLIENKEKIERINRARK